MWHAEMSQLYYWKNLYMDIAKAVKKEISQRSFLLYRKNDGTSIKIFNIFVDVLY